MDLFNYLENAVIVQTQLRAKVVFISRTRLELFEFATIEAQITADMKVSVTYTREIYRYYNVCVVCEPAILGD